MPKKNRNNLFPHYRSGGYLLLQLIIGIVIIIILASITALSLPNFAQTQAMNNDVDEVTALLNQAHSETVSGEDGLTYGVHLEAEQAVLFSGTTYSESASGNKVFALDPRVEINSISLAGGGQDVLFDSLTGDTEEYGTFVIQRVSTPAGAKTLTISKTGEVSAM